MKTKIPSRRILILDDEPGILELLDDYFRSLDFEPVTTSQWTEALEQITHNPPDLILPRPPYADHPGRVSAGVHS